MNTFRRAGGLLFVTLVLVCIGGCNPLSFFQTEAEQELNRWDRLAMEKNESLSLEEMKLEPYAKQVGARLSSPEYQQFAVNSRFKVAGSIEDDGDFLTDWVWIEIKKTDGPKGTGEKTFSYYTRIKKGKFSRSIQLFNGKGEYEVVVRLPGTEKKDRFYDLARFHVINVNPKITREVGYTRTGLESGLKLGDEQQGLQKADGEVQLKGSLKKPGSHRVMVRLEKGGEEWKHLLRVDKKGHFDQRIPLLYGKGIHQVTVMTSDPERKNYYNEAATLLVKNRSDQKRTPIQFFKHYDSRGVNLDVPLAGGGSGKMKYRIKGSIDPKAPFASQTKHLIVQTKKDGMEATYFIPVKNYQFDGQFWLRFGKGAYEVTLNVPEITSQKRDYFRFFGVARFTVNNTEEQDLRNLLPSRGIQSEDASIQRLARQLTQGKTTKREKAKAIYQYVAQNISYDVQKFKQDDFEYDDSALKTLREKSGVCQDYTFLAIALLRSIDLEARFVEGMADGNRHSWVEVKVDGRWLTMDPTWGSGYINQNDQFVKRYTTEYFDPNPSEFQKTHRRIGVMY